MFLIGLILIFIAVPIAELYVIIKVGEAIGALPTVLLLVADSVLGSMLMRSQGRRAWRRFRQALERAAMPHREVIDGVLVIFGGAFLITPGFLTDIVGVLLLFPPTRVPFRRWLTRRLGRRIALRSSFGRTNGYDVEGTATEYEPPPPRLER